MDRGSEKKGDLDTATTSAGAIRVRFRERQVLRATDLAAEQAYLIAMRRRHNIAHHGWGIVNGLELQDTPELAVQPGVAVDGYGRELIVSAPLAITDEAFTELDSDTLDIWLFYDLVQVIVPQRGSWNCGPGRNTRVREQASLLLTAARVVEPRFPVEVASEDFPFPPHRTPPDDPAREWPVYLGTARRADNTRSTRPYATLTGDLITSPSGRARMQVGSELRSDTRRFAVSSADSTGKLIDRLAVDREGNTTLNGDTTILSPAGELGSRQLRLRENRAPAETPTRSTEPLCGPSPGGGDKETPGAARMISFRPLKTTPEVAAPWQIYRTSIKTEQRTIQELRVELGHPGDKGDPKLARLSIGTRASNQFTTRFTLGADCTLTINGNVTVMGELIESPIKPDAEDPRFTELIASQWIKGTEIGEEKVATPPAGIGTIRGSVLDSNGAVLPGVSVEIRNLDTSVVRTVLTDAAGVFVAPNLPVGRYSVFAVVAGFPSQGRDDIELAAGQTVEVTITFSVVIP